MFGKRKPRIKHLNKTSEDAKYLSAQQKYIDVLIENVRQYFIKLDQEHKDLTTLQAYLLAKKIQAEQGKKEVNNPKYNEESQAINSIKLDLCSKLQDSEEEESD